SHKRRGFASTSTTSSSGESAGPDRREARQILVGSLVERSPELSLGDGGCSREARMDRERRVRGGGAHRDLVLLRLGAPRGRRLERLARGRWRLSAGRWQLG